MKRMAGLLMVFFLMYVIALPAGAQEGKKEEPKKEEPKAEETKKEEAKEEAVPQPQRPKSLEEAVKAADIIVVGVVDWLGDKPEGWGRPPFRPSTQYVRYCDLKFLKGQFPSKKMTVVHELFKDSKTAANMPGLNPQMFDIDKKVILILNQLPYGLETGQKVSFMPTDPDFGAIPWTEEDEKKVSGLIGK